MEIKKDLPLTYKFLEKQNEGLYILTAVIISSLLIGGFYIGRN